MSDEMKIYEVKLEKRDLQIISENLEDVLLKEKLSKPIENFGQLRNLTVKFDEQEIDKITDCLSDLFCEHGLLRDDEPNAFGYYIETLIDKFSIE